MITRVEPSITYTFPDDPKTPQNLCGARVGGGRLIYSRRVLCVRFPGIVKPVKVAGRPELERWAKEPPYPGWVLKEDRRGVLGWEDPAVAQEDRSWANGDFVPFAEEPKPKDEDDENLGATSEQHQATVGR